jgi:hypothetical protein
VVREADNSVQWLPGRQASRWSVQNGSLTARQLVFLRVCYKLLQLSLVSRLITASQ